MSKFVCWWVFCFVLADILWVEKFENPARGSRRALGAPLRPPFGASRLTPASAPPLGPGGVPRRNFQSCPAIVKKSSAISKEVQAISKIHAISQKNVAIYIIDEFFFYRFAMGNQKSQKKTIYQKKNSSITPYRLRFFGSKLPY